MNVTCPNCATIFRVDPAKVPEAGVRARCSVCTAIFPVRREGAGVMPTVSTTPRRRRRSGSAHAAGTDEPRPPAPRPVRHRAAGAAPTRAAAAPPRRRPSAAPAAPAPAPASRRHRRRPPARIRRLRPPAPPSPRRARRAAGSAPRRRSRRRRAAADAAAAPAAAARRPQRRRSARLGQSVPVQDPSQKAPPAGAGADLATWSCTIRPSGGRRSGTATLKELFEEEIKKSWEEYVDQVGRELADSHAVLHRRAERDPGRRSARSSSPGDASWRLARAVPRRLARTGGSHRSRWPPSARGPHAGSGCHWTHADLTERLADLGAASLELRGFL